MLLTPSPTYQFPMNEFYFCSCLHRVKFQMVFPTEENLAEKVRRRCQFWGDAESTLLSKILPISRSLCIFSC